MFCRITKMRRKKERPEAKDLMMIFHMFFCVLKIFGGFEMKIQALGKERHQSG
ncbi:hypothetical protein Scep_002003 [Stephania cephalantha]|uniref:Uncharacterized protein n=1 Tax=Stephania cephalantha TaxID=152367 RepID=A0AAP0L939_9MAGN